MDVCGDLPIVYLSHAGKIGALEDVFLRVARCVRIGLSSIIQRRSNPNGNLDRNTVTGPGSYTLDLALWKNVWDTNRQMVSLRAESSNLTNDHNFAVPSGDNLGLCDSRGQRLQIADRITDTATTSRQIQVSLRWSF